MSWIRQRGAWIAAGLACVAWAAVIAAKEPNLSDKQRLGQRLFADPNLSSPAGQSCATCHSPRTGFADPDRSQPTSDGIVAGRFGPRNAPSIAYSAFSPSLFFDEVNGTYVGGQFWDGRADDLQSQAMFPLFNKLEMHNPDPQRVVDAVRRSKYADLFEKVYGAGALHPRKVGDGVVRQALDAIAAYEASPAVAQFSSKFDFVLRGKARFTGAEARGLQLFNGKANCAACHPSTVIGDEPAPLFTDFTYDNIGIPKNWDNPFLHLPRKLNPEGKRFTDFGLAATVALIDPQGAAAEAGKFRVPSLRNVAVTAPYGHNGFFKTLRDAINFYNTRDVPQAGWPEPEVPQTMNADELGNLGLTEAEVDDLIAFLNTLTDGYKPR